MNEGAERLDAIRNRARTESGAREVSNRAPTQLPRGLWLLLRKIKLSRKAILKEQREKIKKEQGAEA